MRGDCMNVLVGFHPYLEHTLGDALKQAKPGRPVHTMEEAKLALLPKPNKYRLVVTVDRLEDLASAEEFIEHLRFVDARNPVIIFTTRQLPRPRVGIYRCSPFRPEDTYRVIRERLCLPELSAS